MSMKIGCQTYIKYLVVASVLILCLYVTINHTGFLIQRYVQPSVIYVPQSIRYNRSKVSTTTDQPDTAVYSVIPVRESDWKQKLPTYQNVPKHIYSTDWWISAQFLQWDLQHRSKDYNCQNIKGVGNWWICLDQKYDINSPCLVYSFGIANDFSFDDAMAEHGCEVHSFDPSMKTKDYTRENGVHYHNLGISSYNDNKFLPRKDIYVKDNETWTIMTLSFIKSALGHKDRTLDVLKIDVEGHEWGVIENLFEDNMFPKIKQFMLEYHLFPKWPKKSEYPKLLAIYKKLHDIGFQKFVTSMHPLTHVPDEFNIQADVAYVNTKFGVSKRKRRIIHS